MCNTDAILETQTPAQECSGGHKNQLHQICALKQFYHLARRKDWYPYPHPLTDPTANLLQDIEAEERREAGLRPRMPQRSGVEEPRHRFLQLPE